MAAIPMQDMTVGAIDSSSLGAMENKQQAEPVMTKQFYPEK